MVLEPTLYCLRSASLLLISLQPMTFATLSGISDLSIVNCFNLAFKDYPIPFHVTLPYMQQKIDAEQIDKRLSAGVFDEGQLVGLVLHGCKQRGPDRIAYNAGTGVLPEYRGRALTVAMYDYILPSLRSAGVSQVVLEVLDSNVAAIKSYKNIGYEPVRILDCYEGAVSSDYLPSASLTIKPISWEDLRSQDFTPSILPSWQNTATAVRRRPDSVVVGAMVNNRLCAYCLVNKDQGRLHQILVDPHMRRQGIAKAMLQWIAATICPIIKVSNVDRSDHAVRSFLLHNGLKVRFVQLEMLLLIR